MTIHHVYACRSNIGDWLSARGIQSLLAPSGVAEHLCDEPFVGQSLRELSSLTKNDLVVVGGGGLLMDYFRAFWNGFVRIAERVPFCLWGIGACDHKGQNSLLPRELMLEIVKKSRLCVVRDAHTQEMLRVESLPAPVPCPAVVAVRPGCHDGYGILHTAHQYLVGPRAHQQIQIIGRDFATSTGRTYREIDHRISDGDERALAEVLRLYAEADVVVSSRLHGCIIGLAMGRRVVAVSGDRKLETFMSSAGLPDWVCDPRDVHGVRERLTKIHQQPSASGFMSAARHANHHIGQLVRLLAERVAADGPVELLADGAAGKTVGGHHDRDGVPQSAGIHLRW